MDVSACLGRFNHPLVILGVYLFIISDSIIAYTMFVSPVYLSSFWVMITYDLAQVLLVWGGFLNRETLYKVVGTKVPGNPLKESGIIGKTVKFRCMPAVAVIGNKDRNTPLSIKISGGEGAVRG